MSLKQLLLLGLIGSLSLSRPLTQDGLRHLEEIEEDAATEEDPAEEDDAAEDEDEPESWAQAFVRLSKGEEEPEEDMEDDDEPAEKKSSRPPAPTEKDWSELFTFLAIMGC